MPKKKKKDLKGLRVIAGKPGVALIQEDGKAKVLVVDGKIWNISRYKKVKD